jgi:hypothetical protein
VVNRKLFRHAHVVTQGDNVRLDAVLAARKRVGAELTPGHCRFYWGDVEVVFAGAPAEVLTVLVKKDGLPLSKSPANVKCA